MEREQAAQEKSGGGDAEGKVGGDVLRFAMEPMDSGEPGAVCEGVWQLPRKGEIWS